MRQTGRLSLKCFVSSLCFFHASKLSDSSPSTPRQAPPIRRGDEREYTTATNSPSTSVSTKKARLFTTPRPQQGRTCGQNYCTGLRARDFCHCPSQGINLTRGPSYDVILRKAVIRPGAVRDETGRKRMSACATQHVIWMWDAVRIKQICFISNHLASRLGSRVAGRALIESFCSVRPLKNDPQFPMSIHKLFSRTSQSDL